MKRGYMSPSCIGTATTNSRSLTCSASKRAGACSGSTIKFTPCSLKCSKFSRSSLSQPPVMCSPLATFSPLACAASVACLSVSSEDASSLEPLKQATDAGQASGEKVASGLHITGGWDKLERENFQHFKRQG